MPYRRLPNTDQARLRALKAVVVRSEECTIRDLAVSLKTVGEVRHFLDKFEKAQIDYQTCFECQSKAARKHQANVRMARLYISHFIQVLNLAVIRAEVRLAHKDMYGLSRNSNTLPDLSSETSLVEWGGKIIQGEQKRLSVGGIPIYNPTIAKVKVHYDIFVESYTLQKGYQQRTQRSLELLASMRARADELILDCWNQVEKKFQEITPNDRRLNRCREYGLVYYFRSHEKIKE